ncbi:trypsin-like serine protease [Sorangium sp. So ce1128]
MGILRKIGVVSLCWAAAGAALLPGCGGNFDDTDGSDTDGSEVDDVEQSAQPIINGTARTVAQAKALGVVLIRQRVSDVSVNYGSGVLLDNNWVLTAAHVVGGATSLSDISVAFEVDGFSSSVPSGVIPAVTAADVVVHPLFNENRNNDVDIALIRLSTPINPSVTYNREVSNLLTTELNGGSVECFGYGRFAYGVTPSPKPLRSGLFSPVLKPGLWTTEYDVNLNGMNQIVDSGDSGGPCLITSSGVTTIAGILKAKSHEISCDTTNNTCPFIPNTSTRETCVDPNPSDTNTVGTCAHVSAIVQAPQSFSGFVRAVLRRPVNVALPGGAPNATLSVSVNSSTHMYEFHLDYSGGSLPPIPTNILDPTGTGDGLVQVEAADMNGDGLVDLVFLVQGRTSPTAARQSFGFFLPGSVITNPSDVNSWQGAIINLFTSTPNIVTPLAAKTLILRDDDGDGRKDVVLVSEDGTENVYFGTTTGLGTQIARALSIDVTKDGVDDRIYITRHSTGVVRWISRNPVGNAANNTTVTYAEPIVAVPGDFNGDGAMDVGVMSGGVPFALQATGFGGLTAASLSAGSGFTSLDVSDVNGDGRTDLEAARPNGEVRAFPGSSTGLTTTPIVLRGFPTADGRDGKFVRLGGGGTPTVADSKVDFYVSEPLNSSGVPTGQSLIIQVFDADSKSLFDSANSDPNIRTCLKLIPDPNPSLSGEAGEGCVLNTTDGASTCSGHKSQDESTVPFVNNGWWTFFDTGHGDTHHPNARVSTTAPRWYRVEVSLAPGCAAAASAGTGGTNALKIRTNGLIRTAHSVTMVGLDSFGPFATSTGVFTPDTSYDGTLDLRFVVGSGAAKYYVTGATAPTGLWLMQADADDPGISAAGDGSNADISYQLFLGEPGASAPLSLLRTSGTGPTGVVTTVQDPSGNSTGATPSFFTHQLQGSLTMGAYTWRWSNVQTGNAIHLLPARSSTGTAALVAPAEDN